MSTDRGMDKEDVVHIYNGILFSHKNNEILPFTRWMDKEDVVYIYIPHEWIRKMWYIYIYTMEYYEWIKKSG